MVEVLVELGTELSLAGIFNVASGESHTNIQVLEMLKSVIFSESELIRLDPRPNDVIHVSLSNEKLLSLYTGELRGLRPHFLTFLTESIDEE